MFGEELSYYQFRCSTCLVMDSCLRNRYYKASKTTKVVDLESG